MFSIIHLRKTSLFIAGALFSSAAWYASPANADASLDELKTKLENAEKENIVLKTEKLERENITMKLEKIEAENAVLRNERKVDKATTASIPAHKTASAPLSNQEAKIVAKRKPIEASIPTPREHVTARREINRALDNISKGDARREMTAAYKVPRDEVSVVVKQWQGIYAGINVGYGTGDINLMSSGWNNSNSSSNGFSPSYFVAGSTLNYNGPTAGGQVGYNYQTSNNFILGSEIDFQYADIRNLAPNGSNQYNYTVSPNSIYAYSNTGRTGLDWYGTARARFGYSLGNFMPFVSAGFAYGYLSQNTLYASANSYGYYSSPSSNYNSVYGNVGSGNNSNISVGWTAGAGAEYKVAENWSVKGEYLYTSLNSLYGDAAVTGSQNAGGAGYTTNSSSNGGWVNTTLGPFGFHQARVGLNYHTGWLGGLDTVGDR